MSIQIKASLAYTHFFNLRFIRVNPRLILLFLV